MNDYGDVAVEIRSKAAKAAYDQILMSKSKIKTK
jgi:hypothetical protein